MWNGFSRCQLSSGLSLLCQSFLITRRSSQASRRSSEKFPFLFSTLRTVCISRDNARHDAEKFVLCRWKHIFRAGGMPRTRLDISLASMLILRFTSRRGRVLKEQLSLKCFLQGVTRRNGRTGTRTPAT